MDTMETPRTRFGQALVRTHFPVDIIMGVIAISLFLIRWDSVGNWERLAYALFIVLCVHQLEEYRFPGGFVWGQNMTMRSPSPTNYPGNSLSATIVDVVATLGAGIWLFFWPSPSLLAFFLLFSALEVVMHVVFGVNAYLRYRSVGKTTIYFPGNLTAFLGFAPLVVVSIHAIVTDGLLTGGQWWLVVLYLAIYMAVGFALPVVAATRRDSPFSYPTVPAEGYYLHKYEEMLKDQTSKR
jgi:hypothetical protein